MNFIILIAFLIPLWRLHFRKENFENYISPVQTTAINGFFVMLVFMRHINQYLDIGKYLFEIYILQRIPMLLLQHSLLNKYIYFILCFVITLILAVGFKRITKRIDHLVDYIFVRRVIVAH